MANSAVNRIRKQRQEYVENLEAQGAEEAERQVDDLPQDDEQEVNLPPQQDQSDDKFERLQGKASKLESDNARIIRELEEAKREISQLKNPPPPQKTQKELDEEFEAQLREEVGEDSWDYMDDASKKAIITIAKRNQKTVPVDVESKVNDALKQRDEQARSRGFVQQMDSLLESHGTSFVQLMNNDKFEKWVQSKRKRLAVFEDIMKHRDEDAVKDMEELVAEFYGAGKASRKDNTTPAVKPTNRTPAPKSEKISYDQYMQALKDKRHPSRREAARKTIAAYLQQQE